MNFNYPKLCKSLLDIVPTRAREVIERRFGLKNNEPETLENIGKDFSITRERVRQIQERAIKQIKESKQDFLKDVFAYFQAEIIKVGGVIKEEAILKKWGGKDQNYVLFLLNLDESFKFSSENKDYFAFWYNSDQAVKEAKKTVENFTKFLKTKGQPVALKDFGSNLSPEVLQSYIEISTNILKSPEGLYGLADWPEVNPRNIRDKAFLALKKQNKPLHFSEIYDMITKAGANPEKSILLQSVHNELIRNPEFVLIGRGIYALKEWGYAPGWVKDILADVIRKEKKSLAKEDLIEKVLAQRQVKKSTILLNLSDKSYFAKDKEGRYTLKA